MIIKFGIASSVVSPFKTNIKPKHDVIYVDTFNLFKAHIC